MSIINKRHMLLRWCRDMGVVSKAQVLQWGLQNYYVSADRVVRKLVEDKLLRRLPKEEAVLRGYKAKMAYYEPATSNKESDLFEESVEI